MEVESINVHDAIDHERIGRMQWTALAIYAFLMMFDAYNTQVISYIVPVLAKEWGLPKSIFGSIFSSALVGMLVGNFGGPFLANRFGHKRMTIVATAALGVLTAGTVFATDTSELITLRFLTGVALGTIAPCIVSLTSEFSPKRTRATFVMLIYVGYAIGFTVAGLCCGAMIPTFGWAAPMWVGALVPIGLLLLLIPLTSESASHIARRGGDLRRVIWRLFPARAIPDGALFTANDNKKADTKISGLFAARLRLGTFLLWAVFIMNLAEFYFLQSWLPTVLLSLSYSPATVVWATAASTAGSMVSGLVMGPLMDRVGPYRILSTLYVFGGISILAIAASLGTAPWIVILGVFFSGICISGSQKGVIALSSIFYPAGLCAAGVAWAYGVGRLGAAGGTYFAGVLYAANWKPVTIFTVEAVPAVVAAACIMWMGMRYSDRSSATATPRERPLEARPMREEL